jgi:hypothetical protein
MECTWQAYYAAEDSALISRFSQVKQNKSVSQTHPLRAGKGRAENQPLLPESELATSSSSRSYLSRMLGASVTTKMNISQYGLTLINSFNNQEGDISGYVAIDDCKCFKYLTYYYYYYYIVDNRP